MCGPLKGKGHSVERLSLVAMERSVLLWSNFFKSILESLHSFVRWFLHNSFSAVKFGDMVGDCNSLESSCLECINVPALFLKKLWLGAVVHVFNPAFGKQKKTDLCGCKVSQSELQVFQSYLVRLLFQQTTTTTKIVFRYDGTHL